MNIEDKLKRWELECSNEKRSYKLLPNSVVNGEKLYMLTMVLIVNFEDQQHEVKESVFFQTFNTNELNQAKKVRTDADNLLLERMCEVLSPKFHTTLEQTISKIYQNI